MPRPLMLLFMLAGSNCLLVWATERETESRGTDGLSSVCLSVCQGRNHVQVVVDNHTVFDAPSSWNPNEFLHIPYISRN